MLAICLLQYASIFINFPFDIQDESYSGWWFGTFFIFPNSWDDDPIWLIFFRGLKPPTRSDYEHCEIHPSWVCFVSLYVKGTSTILKNTLGSTWQEHSRSQKAWEVVVARGQHQSAMQCIGSGPLQFPGPRSWCLLPLCLRQVPVYEAVFIHFEACTKQLLLRKRPFLSTVKVPASTCHQCWMIHFGWSSHHE